LTHADDRYSSQWGASFVEALKQFAKTRMVKERRRVDSAIAMDALV
jgi:hypothetical protein